MGAVEGLKQKTYYVREDLARIIEHIAARDDKRNYEIINEALEYFVRKKLTKEERRVFGYKKGMSNGHAAGSDAGSSGGNAATANGRRGAAKSR